MNVWLLPALITKLEQFKALITQPQNMILYRFEQEVRVY